MTQQPSLDRRAAEMNAAAREHADSGYRTGTGGSSSV